MFKKKPLDYLIIPDSGKVVMKARKDRAKKELKNRVVYEILIVKGRDSEEDILYLGKILKKGDRIGFDTFPLHFKEYKELIRKAKRDNKFPKGIKIENVGTRQTFRQTIYGILGLEEEKLKKRKLKYMRNRNDKFYRKIKSFIKRIIT